MEWPAGHQIQDRRYTIQQVLGQGGFGITYLAWDQKRADHVVIKTPNAAMQLDPDFERLQQGFLNEALRLAMCNHTYIVKVYEIILEAGLVCIVMEYIHGTTLERRIRNEGALLESTALHYTRQVGAALKVLHGQDFLHRDIKPANILLRHQQSEAVLIDFGLARDFSQGLIQRHTSWGTDGYAPIEQYDSLRRRGAWIDVYALAATLYTMVTGQIPLCSPARAAGGSLIPPKHINVNISHTINEAIIQGMALQAVERTQTIEAWLELLPKPYIGISTQDLVDLQQSLDAQSTNAPSTPIIVPEVLNSDQPKAGLIPGQLGTLASVPSTPPALTTLAIKPVGNPTPPVPTSSTPEALYQSLWTALRSRNWYLADQETTRLMLKLGQCEDKVQFSLEAIQSFPNQHLQVIDKLWKQFSHGHFSFSVQQSIFIHCRKNSELFARKVGWMIQDKWLSYRDLQYGKGAPQGHLPIGFFTGYSGGLKSAMLVLDRYWLIKLNQCLGHPTLN